MESIFTKKAPVVVGPYSQAIKSNGFIFCSGQIGIDPKNGELTKGIEEQTTQVMKNVQTVLEAAGSSLKDVIKTTIYLSNIEDYAVVNKIYGEYFPGTKPARSTVGGLDLPREALIEIEAIAVN